MTEKLRAWLRALNCGWSEGYRLRGGERTDIDDVTQVMVHGHWITIEEAYDGTFTIMDLDFDDVCDFLKPAITNR